MEAAKRVGLYRARLVFLLWKAELVRKNGSFAHHVCRLSRVVRENVGFTHKVFWIMQKFGERERICQTTFANNGPFWHCYTSGKGTAILFSNHSDHVFAMNVIAQSAAEFKHRVKIIAFEIMDNHFHFILMCEEEDAYAFFNFIRRRMGRTIPPIRILQLYCKRIDSLQNLRNAIAYVNRNGYVVSPDHTPFSYPWGSNRYYFLNIPISMCIGSIKDSDIREMFKGRNPNLPDNWGLIDGYVAPNFYCAVGLGMSLFRDAHHYFNMVSKSIESYSGIATDLDDDEFLTDPELFCELLRIIKENYSASRFSDMSKAQKLDLAKVMRFKYHSSNGQISRILGISQYDVCQLFGQ